MHVEARAASYVLLAETDEGCKVYLDGVDFVLEGCNVHVRNGAGATETVNARGNLIIGYDEAATEHDDEGGAEKTGSHNLIVGSQHNYSSYGGLVAGQRNAVHAPFATVGGGADNVAIGAWSAVGDGGMFCSEPVSIRDGVRSEVVQVALDPLVVVELDRVKDEGLARPLELSRREGVRAGLHLGALLARHLAESFGPRLSRVRAFLAH